MTGQEELYRRLLQQKLAGTKTSNGGYAFNSNETAARLALEIFQLASPEVLAAALGGTYVNPASAGTIEPLRRTLAELGPVLVLPTRKVEL